MTAGPVETQPERTALAWQRTGLGVLAVAALLVLGAMRKESPVLLGVACVVALLGLGTLAGLGTARYRRLRRSLHTGASVSAPGMAACVTAAVVLTAAAAAVGVVAGY
jgi:putative membrane protein